MKKISRIRWLTTLMGLVVLMFTCAGCGQTVAQSNVPKPDASQSRVRIYESMVELEDDSPLIITGEISRTSVIRDIDDITDIPDDSPSRPSIKLIAFVIPTIHPTVNI